MKKWIAAFMAFIMVVTVSGCEQNTASTKDDGLHIVTTIFPEYDWIENIIGENPAGAEVTLLLDNGVDLHSYQPTATDIVQIVSCDMFVYVGGESDFWVEDALKNAANPDMIVVNLMDVLGDTAKEEELIEGMQPEDEGEADSDDEAEYDEHVWLSLKNATVITEYLKKALEKADPDHSATYQKNAAAYIDAINALDVDYENAVSAASKNTLLFGDRFPFRYMTDDYDIDYYAAFQGCSAETEASFETVTFLADKLDELGLGSVMIIDGSDGEIAETIIENTEKKDQEILTLDSMQSTTSEDIASGTTYISIMEKNLAVLKQALQ